METCKGCRCETCRWRAAGSLCHYKMRGEVTSRCTVCAIDSMRKKAKVDAWKNASYECKGYEKEIGGITNDAK